MRFAVRNHRERRKLTLAGDLDERGNRVSLTLPLPGTRVITLADDLCVKYASALEAHCRSGALVALEGPAAG